MDGIAPAMDDRMSSRPLTVGGCGDQPTLAPTSEGAPTYELATLSRKVFPYLQEISNVVIRGFRK